MRPRPLASPCRERPRPKAAPRAARPPAPRPLAHRELRGDPAAGPTPRLGQPATPDPAPRRHLCGAKPPGSWSLAHLEALGAEVQAARAGVRPLWARTSLEARNRDRFARTTPLRGRTALRRATQWGPPPRRHLPRPPMLGQHPVCLATSSLGHQGPPRRHLRAGDTLPKPPRHPLLAGVRSRGLDGHAIHRTFPTRGCAAGARSDPVSTSRC